MKHLKEFKQVIENEIQARETSLVKLRDILVRHNKSFSGDISHQSLVIKIDTYNHVLVLLDAEIKYLEENTIRQVV